MSLEGVSRDVLSLVCGFLTLQDVARLSAVSRLLRATTNVMRLVQVRVAPVVNAGHVERALVKQTSLRKLVLPLYIDSVVCTVLEHCPLLSHLVLAAPSFPWSLTAPPNAIVAVHLESLTLVESALAYGTARFRGDELVLHMDTFVTFWSVVAPGLKQLHIGTIVSKASPAFGIGHGGGFGAYAVPDNTNPSADDCAPRMPSVQTISIVRHKGVDFDMFPNLTTCFYLQPQKGTAGLEAATPKVTFVRPFIASDGDLDLSNASFVTDIDAMGEQGAMHVLARNLNIGGMERLKKVFPNASLDLRTQVAPEPAFEFQYPHFGCRSEEGLSFDVAEGFTPLMLAMMANPDKEVMERLVRLGCGVECVTLRHRWTPLMVACALGNVEVAKVLVTDFKVDVFKRDVCGWTALHILCASTLQVAFSFFPKEAFAVRDFYGLTPIDVAAAFGTFGSPMDDAYQPAGAKARIPKSDGDTSESESVHTVSDMVFFLVHMAFSWNLESKLLSLARHFNSWNFRSPDDRSTPLIFAVRRKFPLLCAAIVGTRSGKLSIDLRDDAGRSALHYACIARDDSLIESLLHIGGADTCVVDSENSTPALYYLQSTSGAPIGSSKVSLLFFVFFFVFFLNFFRFWRGLLQRERAIWQTWKRAQRRYYSRAIYGTTRFAACSSQKASGYIFSFFFFFFFFLICTSKSCECGDGRGTQLFSSGGVAQRSERAQLLRLSVCEIN
jgi:hypothetical protein